jgi:glycosyltransferase involved in cell wall biosynthesis
MQDETLVTILINNYNYAEFLSDAIESALGQSYKNIEVIIVDDGSTDNSIEIIKKYEDKIHLLLKENGGQASAFNIGFKESNGDIVCLLDSDDFFAHDKIERIVDLFNQYQSVHWIFHELRFVNEFGQVIPLGTLPADVYKNINLRRSNFQDKQLIDFRRRSGKFKNVSYVGPATSGLCFRRNLLDKILPMPESVSILSDHYLKIATKHLAVGMHLMEELACLRIHSSNAYSFKNNKLTRGIIEIKTAYYLRKKFPKLEMFTDKMFASSVGRLIITYNIKNLLEIKELHEYAENYLPMRSWLYLSPVIVINIVKEFISKK